VLPNVVGASSVIICHVIKHMSLWSSFIAIIALKTEELILNSN